MCTHNIYTALRATAAVVWMKCAVSTAAVPCCLFVHYLLLQSSTHAMAMHGCSCRKTKKTSRLLLLYYADRSLLTMPYIHTRWTLRELSTHIKYGYTPGYVIVHRLYTFITDTLLVRVPHLLLLLPPLLHGSCVVRKRMRTETAEGDTHTYMRYIKTIFINAKQLARSSK